MVSALEANGIPHFVLNRGFGGLYPGMKVHLYNDQRIMIPQNRAADDDTKPVADYGALARDKSLYVLEVGVINYEIEPGGKLLVQVAMKVIDPSNGSVIGRARAANPWNMPQQSPLDQAFSGDASHFKEAFLKTGQEITKKCLTELGLIQPSRE